MRHCLFLSFLLFSFMISFGEVLILPEIDINSYPPIRKMALQAIAKGDSVIGRHAKSHSVTIFSDTKTEGKIAHFVTSTSSDLDFHYIFDDSLQRIKEDCCGYFKISDVIFFVGEYSKKALPNMKFTGHKKSFRLIKEPMPDFVGIDDSEFERTWWFYEKDNKVRTFDPWK